MDNQDQGELDPKRVIILVVAIVAIIGAAIGITYALTRDKADTIYQSSRCAVEELPSIDSTLTTNDVQQRIKDMIAVAKAERANEIELTTLVDIAYSETRFGGISIPDSDQFDIFSQQVEDGIYADPTTSTRKMLERIRKVRGNETDPGKVAGIAARSNDNQKYIANVGTSKRIINAVGGC